MVKVSISAALLFAVLACGLGTSAAAAPAATSKQIAGATGARPYWLADGLNRLVFWKPPEASRHEVEPSR